MAEQHAHNVSVIGSNPIGPTKENKMKDKNRYILEMMSQEIKNGNCNAIINVIERAKLTTSETNEFLLYIAHEIDDLVEHGD